MVISNLQIAFVLSYKHPHYNSNVLHTFTHDDFPKVIYTSRMHPPFLVWLFEQNLNYSVCKNNLGSFHNTKGER